MYSQDLKHWHTCFWNAYKMKIKGKTPDTDHQSNDQTLDFLCKIVFLFQSDLALAVLYLAT